jgi:hypothetical protein
VILSIGLVCTVRERPRKFDTLYRTPCGDEASYILYLNNRSIMLPAKQEKSDILYFGAWQRGGTSTVSKTWGYEEYKHAGKNWKEEANSTQECSSLAFSIHFISVSLQSCSILDCLFVV